MQTGYDNFWMYQNSRHEPVLNPTKNDNQSQAVLTDSYKQMQNGGHPNFLNSSIPPQDNIARSHANDQHRPPQSQFMWPSSVYPYASNFHPHAPFSTQSNSSGYSSHFAHAVQNLSDGSNLRTCKNPNKNIYQVKSQNSGNHNRNSAVNSQNSVAHISRIRVRDVFSLNKSTVPSEVLNGNSYQKEQSGYFNCNTTLYGENQSQFVGYDGSRLPQPITPSHPPPYYGNHQMVNHPTAAGFNQQFHQNSALFYEQNYESQHQFVVSQQADRNLNFEASTRQNVSAPKDILRQFLSQTSRVQKNRPQQQNNRRISESVNKTVTGEPIRNIVQAANLVRTNNTSNRDSLDVNNRLTCESSNLSGQSQDGCSFGNNSSTAAPSTGSPISPVNLGGQETVIKISIPHSGQSTCITLGDYNSTNTSLSLPCLLDGNDSFFSEWDQNHSKTKERSVANVTAPKTHKTSVGNPPTGSNESLTSPTAENCHNSVSEARKNVTVPPRKRFCHVKESFLDLNKENFDEFLNPNVESCSDSSYTRVRDSDSIVRETTFQEKITLNALELKKEKLNGISEEADVHESKKVLFEIIKKEKNPTEEVTSVEEDGEEELSEETNSAEESLTSEVEFIEDSSVDLKEFGCLPQMLSQPIGERVDNSVQQGKNLNNSRDTRKESSTEGEQARPPTDINYRSRINRNKLDKLIQFLEMDEETVGCVPGKKDSKSKKEIDLNHNRRKLSKTFVVKNKNNSREMISMKSNKNARMEGAKCPAPPTPANSDKVREGRSSAEEKSKTYKSGEPLEIHSHVKSDSPRVTKSQGEITCEKSESKNVISESLATKSQESPREKEENIMNRIRHLRSLAAIFCGNCDFLSSIDSYWVNVASGEMKCSNCFKIALEPKENNRTSNTTSNSGGKTVQKEITDKNNREDALEDSSDKDNSGTKGPSKSKRADDSPRNLEKIIKQEPVDSHVRKESAEQKASIIREEKQMKHGKGEMKNGMSKRRDSTSKENCAKPPKEGSAGVRVTSVENQRKDQPLDQPLRKSISKEQDHVRISTLIETAVSEEYTKSSKKQEPVRSSTVVERVIAEECTRRDKKNVEGSNQTRRRSDSRDFFSCKSPEENSRKESETVTDSSDKSAVKKTKECHSKDNNTTLTTKKSTRHEHPEKTIQSPSRENGTCPKPKDSDQSEEFRAKMANNSDKHKQIDFSGQSRKRKNSEEDPRSGKVRIVEEQTKNDAKPVQVKRSTSTTSKDDIETQKTKAVDCETQKVKRNSFSKEDQTRCSSKEKEALKEDPMYQKIRAYEQAKQKASELTEMARRKGKEEQVVHKQTKNEMRQTVETSERRKSKDDVHFGEIQKRESVIVENKERKKSEEKEKNHSTRKSNAASRPLKENQNTKERSEKQKERKKHSEERKGGKGDRETSEKNNRKKIESSSNKKNVEGKREKIQTENRHGKDLEKAVERCLGGKTEDRAQTKAQEKNSATLLSKLIRKTKKLSWNLLNEA